MKNNEIKALKNEISNLQKQICKIGPMMRGSIVRIGTKNKQPYFSVNINKKTKLIYLGEKRESRAKEYLDNYKLLQNIIETMTELNMKLLKLENEN